MASQVTNYQCPSCTGPLHFEGTSGKLECEYCGGSFEVAEVEALYKEKEERAAKAMEEQKNSQWNTGELTENWGDEGENLKNYSCPSCGAELICDETTAATCCPYCGNQTVIPGNFTGALKPDFLIPFKTDKEAAKAALREHYKGKRLLPKSFVEENHIEDIQGVYVPFWLYDCVAKGDMRFHASTSTTSRSGNVETTTTKHYAVERAGSIAFEKVPVDASSRMPDGHMDCIEPYDYNEMRPFSTGYMPGFLADKYDVEAQECGARMEERCTKTLEDELTATVTGYSKRETKEKNLVIQKGDVHYAMLPVWMLATKWQDQNYLFAMNGQSGKLVGDLPVDKKKFWGYFAGITLAAFAVIFLLCNVVMQYDMQGAALVFIEVLLPLLIGFISVSIMKGQLKSIRKQTAHSYIDKNGLTLSVKVDQYLRTTVQKRTIQSTQK